MKMMKLVSVALAAIVLTSCASRIPVTDRKQRLLNNEQSLIDQAQLQYDEFLKTANVLDSTDARAAKVTEIGDKIKNSVEAYLEKKHQMNRVEGFAWEFNTVVDSVVNAWCMPGGKVVVYTGILDLAANDDELAVVMGHEIAHAIARHGNERMTKMYGTEAIKVILGVATGGNEQLMQIYGVGTTLGILKYSRSHETESDKMGLVFMKLAGYDPYAAISFWEKMASNGGSTPEIFSTHPSDETRIADIKAFIETIDSYLE